MKLVIQRVTNASVSVDGSTVGSIGKGLLVLVGIEADDTDEMLPKFVNKMLKLRILRTRTARPTNPLPTSMVHFSSFRSSLYAPTAVTETDPDLPMPRHRTKPAACMKHL